MDAIHVVVLFYNAKHNSTSVIVIRTHSLSSPANENCFPPVIVFKPTSVFTEICLEQALIRQTNQYLQCLAMRPSKTFNSNLLKLPFMRGKKETRKQGCKRN